MSNNTPYMKVNDSDKQRTSGNILPGEQAHTSGDGDNGCGEKMKQHKYKIIGIVVVLIVAIILGVTLSGSSDSPTPGPTPTPGPGPTPEPINHGYNPYFLNETSLIMSNKNKVNGRLYFNQSYDSNTDNENLRAQQRYRDSVNITLVPSSIPIGDNNEWMKTVEYDFSQVDYKITKVMFTDALKERFSINETLVGSKKDSSNMTLDAAGFKMYQEPFGFEFRSTRQPNVVNVFTNSSDFVMTDKFMQLDLQMPSGRIYGLGERQREFSLVPGTWTMWANGRESQYDDGAGGKQTYGVHPFALVQTQQKDEWMGIFFRNSNAQSPIITNKTDGNYTLTYLTTGGQLEMYFFTKGSSKEIIQAYHNLIGKPTLTPFWSLGLQVIPSVANDIQAYDAVIQKFKNDGTPLEGLFLDVNYLSDGADFTVNTTTFPNLKIWSQNLKKNNQKLSVVLDGSLSSDNFENYYYSQASLQKVLLKSTVHPGWLTNTVWSKKSVFLDFMNDQAALIWMHGINALFEDVDYDGIWLDWNEATGLCDGECVDGFVKTTQTSQKRSLKEKILENTAEFIDIEILGEEKNMGWYNSWTDQTNQSTYEIPFSPGQDNLDHMSLSLNATHVDGASEYNLHSLFGHAQGMQTHRILSDITYNPNTPLRDQRTFILSRSTFAGSGQYVQHWLGDNHRNWDNMKWSIAGIMNFNMFGIPMVGPDICGTFIDKSLNQTEQNELCARWVELSSFYPLARYRIPSGLQLGGTEANPTLYEDMTKSAIKERFWYLRHMYTCQLRVHRNGGTCFDPLLMHYPHDDNVFATNQTEHTFLVGDAIKVTPVTESGAQNVSSYFPTGQWVSLRDFKIVVSAAPAPAGGQMMTLNATNGINAHLRPGYMVPKEACDNCKTTFDLRVNGKISMIANRDSQGHAMGELFLDSGDTLSEISTQTYEYYQFQLSAGSIKKWVLNEKNSGPVGHGIDSFIIANAKELLSIDFACWVSEADNTATPFKIGRNASLNYVSLSNLDSTPIQPFYVKNIYFGNSMTDLNLCGANGTDGTDSAAMAQFYTIAAVPILTGNNATINITGNHASNSAQPDLTLTLQILNTQIDGKDDIDVLNIMWTYTDNATSAKIPYSVPMEIAGCDKTILQDDGKLKDWVNIVIDSTTKSFEIVVNNVEGRSIFTLSSAMSFGEYINVIQGKAHAYVGTDGIGFKGMMGLSQQTTSDLFLDDGMYSLWSRDPVDPQETVRNPDQNAYSTHPYIMGKDKGNGWFGMFANNAAAQDWWIKNNATTGDVDVKIMATGGVGDLYFFQGRNPQRLTEAYHRIVGRPVVTPQWALGWHQSQWGYKNTGQIKKVAEGFFEQNFPLEALWADIDYMQDFKDFTVDQKNFGDLGEYLQGLKTTNNIKFIPIVDAGIAQRLPEVDNYPVYNEGKDQNVFIKSGALNQYDYQVHQFTGQTWAGDAAFVDFTAENAQIFWSKQLDNLSQNLSYSVDGIWLNSNEASNQLCNGVCYTDQRAVNPLQWNLPYIPTGGNLESHALPLDATHTDQIKELDIHSLYGTMETMATDTWFKDQKKRTMIIERSSYAGLGQFGSQWLGDNYSKPQYMGFSVTGTMAHNLAGIPLTGADVCGFAGDTNAELCARWYTVGAFYPFSRNHNSIDSAPQLPWTFNTVYMGTVTYDQIIRQAMYTKLNLIRYYYTQMSICQEQGGAFYRPLFYDFPNDNMAYQNQELNIMLGPSLKLGIQSKSMNTLTEFYYPAGRYCSVFCKKETNCCVLYKTGTSVPSPSYAFSFNLDLIAGNIIPMQDALAISEKVIGAMKNITTAYLQKEPVEIHIMPACNDDTTPQFCTATGDYINDDGFTTDIKNERKHFSFTYSHNVSATAGAAPDSMMIEVASEGPNSTINENDVIGGIQIYDYTNLNFTGAEYTVAVNEVGKDQPTDIGSTSFKQQNDRLVWVKADTGKFYDLRFITSLTFTKKA